MSISRSNSYCGIEFCLGVTSPWGNLEQLRWNGEPKMWCNLLFVPKI